MKEVMAPIPAESSAVPAVDAGFFDALYRDNVKAVYRYAASRLGQEEGRRRNRRGLPRRDQGPRQGRRSVRRMVDGCGEEQGDRPLEKDRTT